MQGLEQMLGMPVFSARVSNEVKPSNQQNYSKICIVALVAVGIISIVIITVLMKGRKRKIDGQGLWIPPDFPAGFFFLCYMLTFLLKYALFSLKDINPFN